MILKPHKQIGFTLIEVLLTIVISTLLITTISGVVNQAVQAHKVVREQNDLTRQARFAMQQINQIVSQTKLLLIPMRDKPFTPLLENIREQTIPASAMVSGGINASAVIAVTLPTDIDQNGDGIADADNDGDGKIDEDLPDDIHNDGKAGIVGIDDNGDGDVDGKSLGLLALIFFKSADDDESGEFSTNEDSLNGINGAGAGIDDDGDGNIDDDISADNNYDGCPGICSVDDDLDGSIDEGHRDDDDEDGLIDEDWFDPVVFYISGNNLLQRTPVPWDVNLSGDITGQDYIEEIIASNVSHFRVERIKQNSDRSESIIVVLELTNPSSGAKFSLTRQIRIGGRSV